MLRVGSWLYGKKVANASTQSLDSLVELKDCTYFRDVVLLDLRLSYFFYLTRTDCVCPCADARRAGKWMKR